MTKASLVSAATTADPNPGFAPTVQEESLPADFSLPFEDPPSSVPAEAPLLSEGEPTIGHVGRYALKRLLGAGGLGTVHAAWDPILSRAVAIKTLNIESAGADRRTLDAMFLHEARAVAGLSHPHIVTVFDAGQGDSGVYLAMEHLHGQDLRRMLADGWQPTPLQAAKLVRRVADALAYAHGMGVIHCDVKPANIFMVGQRRPKVLDFGIARVARHGVDGQGAVEPLAGSPLYAAPEQLRGGTSDPRTDVHALGVLLYELLARRKAFEGSSLEQIAAAVAGSRPPCAHDLNPEVPRALSDIAARAMALDPAERFASARDMAAALRRASAALSAPVARHAAPKRAPSKSPVPASRPARRPVRRAMLAIGAVVLAAGAAWWLIGQGRDGRASAPAVDTGHPAIAAAVVAAPAAQHVAPTTAEPAPIEAPSSASNAAPVSAIRPAVSLGPSRIRTGKGRDGADARAAEEAGPQVAAAPPVAPAQGLLQLAISPWGQVEIDGKPAGTTPPLSRLNLPEGEHTVTIRNEDFPAHSVTVKVTPDQTVTVRHRFGS